MSNKPNFFPQDLGGIISDYKHRKGNSYLSQYLVEPWWELSYQHQLFKAQEQIGLFLLAREELSAQKAAFRSPAFLLPSFF